MNQAVRFDNKDREKEMQTALAEYQAHGEVANTNIEAVFDAIGKKYQAVGYTMPQLIFWNVCGRTDTIPKVDNEQGICLLSGFSQNVMKVAANQETKDHYEKLLKTLDSPSYKRVELALRKIA